VVVDNADADHARLQVLVVTFESKACADDPVA